MKKFTIKVCLAIFCFTNFQTQAQTVTHVIDSLFQYIDKSPITSNIFIDRVFSSSGVQKFNQGVRKDTSSFIHFKQTWSDLNRASYVQDFVTIAQFKQQLKNKNYALNIVPIGIINTSFHQSNLGTNAANANVNYSNGFMRNKSGKNPFLEKQATVIAPLVSFASGTSITFKTDNLFKLHKHGKTIKTLQLFTNNTSFTLISNYNLNTNNFTTTYQNSGVKVLRFVVTYNDNSTKTTYGKVKIQVNNSYLQREPFKSALDTIRADSDLWYKGYDESQKYQGENEYRIFYNRLRPDNGIVTNPIIIIDGYDPNDVRKIEKTDIGHQSEKSIVELMSYKLPNGNREDLIEELQLKGFDVIILNPNKYKRGTKEIDGGSDYIQRNAYVLISMIRYIKSIQQGTNKMVIIGPSMGGLISRYALAKMEQKLAQTNDSTKWYHNTRLWVSFDSPHQGANIPIGVQKGIQYFADKLDNEGAKDFVAELNNPAPKLMLVNHFTNETYLPVGAPNFRNRFRTELDNLGMPQNLRKIALLNGSIMGALNGVSEGKYLEINSDAFEFTGNVRAKVFTDFFHATNKKNGNIKSSIFYGRKRISVYLFGIKVYQGTSGRHKKYSAPNLKGSYDISPGSYYNSQALLASESIGTSFFVEFFLFIASTSANLIDPTHTFIPTKSALAYTGNNVLDEVIGGKNRVCTGETPFDSYFAPQKNQEHIFLTPENVDWLTEEILGNPQPPNTFTSSEYITSLNGNGQQICYNEEAIFSFNTCNSPSEINWATSSNLQIIDIQDNWVKVKSIDPLNNTHTSIGTITATVTVKGVTRDVTGTALLMKEPEPSQKVTINIVPVKGQSSLSVNNWNTFYIPEFFTEMGEVWEWKIENAQIRKSNHPLNNNIHHVPLSNNCSSNSGSNLWLYGNAFLLKPISRGWLTIKVKKHNKCGCSDWVEKRFWVN